MDHMHLFCLSLLPEIKIGKEGGRDGGSLLDAVLRGAESGAHCASIAIAPALHSVSVSLSLLSRN